MKIAQVVSTFPPYHGGTGNAVFNIARELANLGHEVTVFTPEYSCHSRESGNPEKRTGSPIESGMTEGLKVVRIKPVIKIGNAAWVPQLLWKLRGFDVVHLHAPFIGAELVLKRQFILNVMPNLFRHLRSRNKFGMTGKQKLVTTYHHDLIGHGFRGVIFGLWNKIILPWVGWLSDKIIGSSLDYIEHSNFGAYYKSHSQKFVGIPFGVDTEKFKPLLRQGFEGQAKSLGFSADEKIILFVGGLDTAHNFKGVGHLISAAKILKDRGMRFRVVIVGDGDLRAGFEKRVLDLELRHVVKFSSGGRDTLPDLYNLATVEVLPSTTMGEAFGLVLLEAMACGKPVIASNLPGVRTVCEDGVNGLLIKPGDEKDLAEKLARILTDENLAKQLGEAGLELIHEKYDWRKVAEKHSEVYNNL